MTESLRPEDVARVIACVHGHERRAALAAFAYDVLGTQAEGRALFAGQKFMAARAQAHELDADKANTELGNLLQILERGPSDRGEHALIAGFAASGFADAFAAASGEARAALVAKLCADVTWLDSSTRYRVWPLLLALLDLEPKQALVAALAKSVLSEERGADASDPDLPGLRATLAVRLSLLHAAGDELARPALEQLRRDAKDPTVRAQVGALLGDAPAVPAAVTLRVFGRAASTSKRPLLALLRWLSGYAVLQAALRGLGYLVRFHRDVELELDARALRATRRTLLFGRIVRASQAIYPLERIHGATRSGRYALVRTIVGAIALSFGLLAGGYFGFDAARGGAHVLLALAASVCALGAGLDLALEILGPAVRGDVQLQIDLAQARALAVRGIPRPDADRFLDAIAKQLATRG